MSHQYIRPLRYQFVSSDKSDVLDDEDESGCMKLTNKAESSSLADVSNKASLSEKSMESFSTAIAQSFSKIKPCVTDGSSHIISKFQYEEWRDHIISSLASHPEKAKYAKVKLFGGDQIISILNALDIDDEIRNSSEPFTNAIQKLNEYFDKQVGSFSSQMSFRSTEQLDKENCVLFLSRLLKAAKHCGFAVGSTQREVITAVATNANDKDFRKAASKPGATVMSLRESAEIIDAQNLISAKKLITTSVAAVNEVAKSQKKRHRNSSESSEDDKLRQKRRGESYRQGC